MGGTYIQYIQVRKIKHLIKSSRMLPINIRKSLCSTSGFEQFNRPPVINFPVPTARQFGHSKFAQGKLASQQEMTTLLSFHADHNIEVVRGNYSFKGFKCQVASNASHRRHAAEKLLCFSLQQNRLLKQIHLMFCSIDLGNQSLWRMASTCKLIRPFIFNTLSV